MIILPQNFKLLFRGISGSNLYGTNTPLSDIDERGVFIPSEEYFLGFYHRTEQYEDKQNDIVYFEVKKFFGLCLDNNPNVIELLFIPENKWLSSTNEWYEIIENKKLFICKKCKFTFSGYAHSQFNRIKLHRSWLLNPPKKKPERKDFGLFENQRTLTRDQIGAFNALLALKLENIHEFHPLKEQLENMRETHDYKALCKQHTQIDSNAIKEIIPISDEYIEILQKENSYSQAERYFNQYLNWKKSRNPERAILEEKYGFDVKHGSHLIRLISEGEELLMTGHITFPRPDVEYLKSIKNGKYKYEEIFEILESYDKKFDELYLKSPLPHSPEIEKADQLCIKLVKQHISVG